MLSPLWAGVSRLCFFYKCYRHLKNVKWPVCICDINNFILYYLLSVTTTSLITLSLNQKENRAMFSVLLSQVIEDTQYMMCYVFKKRYYSTIHVKDAFVMQTRSRGHAPIKGEGALVMETSGQMQTSNTGKGALVVETSDQLQT